MRQEYLKMRRLKKLLGWQGTDGVELGNDDTGHGAKEAENVAPPWIVVCCVSFLKELDSRVNAILSYSLKMNIKKGFVVVLCVLT